MIGITPNIMQEVPIMITTIWIGVIRIYVATIDMIRIGVIRICLITIKAIGIDATVNVNEANVHILR